MHVLYYGKLRKAKNYKFIMKKKRILFYRLNKKLQDHRDIDFIKKSLKSRFAEYLIDSSKFDKEKV